MHSRRFLTFFGWKKLVYKTSAFLHLGLNKRNSLQHPLYINSIMKQIRNLYISIKKILLPLQTLFTITLIFPQINFDVNKNG